MGEKTNRDAATEIVIALIEKGSISPNNAGELSGDYNQNLADEVAKVYKTIIKAIQSPNS